MNEIVGHIENTYPCFSPYIHALGSRSLFNCHKLTFFSQFYRFSDFYRFVGFILVGWVFFSQ